MKCITVFRIGKIGSSFREKTMTTWKGIIKTGDVQAVRDYIAAGADANAKDDAGNTLADWSETRKESATLFPDFP